MSCHLFANIDPGNTSTQQDILRLKHFLVFVGFGVPAMMIYGVYNYSVGSTTLAFSIFFLIFLFLVGAVFQARRPAGMLVFRFCGVAYCSLLLYMFVLGGEGGSKALWLFTFPLIGFFLLGKKEGLVWTLLLITAVTFLHITPQNIIGIYDYSEEFFIRLVSVYVIVSGVSAWFEHFRTSYYVMNQQGNQKFMEILEYSRDIIYRRDLTSGEYDYISDAFFSMLGHDRKELKSQHYKSIESLIHPDDLELHREYILALVKGQDSHPGKGIEYRMRDKNGTYLWFNDLINVIHGATGKPDHVIGINRENTAYRNTSKALERSQEQLLAILNGMDAHVYVADMQDYTILFMNQKMRNDFGKDCRGEICWRSFRNLDGPCDHCTNNDLLDQEAQPTGVYEWEAHNPVVGKWYRNYDRAIQWVDGSWVRLQIAVDITREKEIDAERKKNEEILQRTKQLEAIGSLAGGIAHDFNNIIQVIRGNVDLVQLDKGLGPSGREYLEQITLASNKARDLANKLISFSPGGNLFLEEMDISSFLREIVLVNINTEECSLEMTIDPAIWPIKGDRQQLMVAFSNILNNSIESFNGLMGRLEIVAENHTQQQQSKNHTVLLTAGKYVKIEIGDNGNGIAAAVLERVFDPYFSTKKMSSVKGVGLGLSIAYSIIKRHNGDINIESREGDGTRLKIFLPA
jgi:PAS domain S-box-containing protein